MGVLLLFAFATFWFQLVALGHLKNRLLRWFPVLLIESLLLVGMVRHWLDPPSFDILGWEPYLWLMGSVCLGGILAWSAYIHLTGGKR